MLWKQHRASAWQHHPQIEQFASLQRATHSNWVSIAICVQCGNPSYVCVHSAGAHTAHMLGTYRGHATGGHGDTRRSSDGWERSSGAMQ
jgi:hypothetical protein